MDEIWRASASSVVVEERTTPPMILVRLRSPSSRDLRRIGDLIGVALPEVPNRVAEGAIRAIWKGPDEWLLIGHTAPVAALEDAAGDAAAALCVNVRDGHATFHVTGPDAADLLAKGTSIDVDPTVFLDAMSAMTLFAQVNATIDRPPGVEGFRLFVDISVRDYVRQWFEDALVEFG